MVNGITDAYIENIVVFDKANKGVRWMPWHMKAMKDVVSCEKPREGANSLRSGDVRMGQPIPSHVGILPPELIGWGE